MLWNMDSSGGSMPFKFRLLPVLTAAVLAFALPWLASELVDFARHYSHAIPPMADTLGRAYTEYAVLLALSLAAVGAMKWLAPGDYGLHPPREEKTYLGTALLWGLGLGVAMTALDYPEFVFSQTAPKGARALTAFGWLGFQGVFAGAVEEILFRALLVTFLSVAMPGSLSIGRLRMNGAGIVVAVFYSLYAADFVHRPFELALGQMALALIAGIAFAYWIEKSKSVFAPVLGHNIAGAVEWALLLAMVTAWA
jgi:hypothetical protein